MVQMLAIDTSRLSKAYGAVRPVTGLNLQVERGEVYAFLGRNGAGKTTTIRMLLGMVRPTTGAVALFGEPVRTGGRGPWRRVGQMVDVPAAYPELTVRENLDGARRLAGVPDRGAVDRAMERLGIADQAGRRARVLSRGNLQRLGLARALISDPDLLILDEPTNGLDPAAVVEIRTLLQDLARDHGTTVFMSSHILGEVERLASRIGIIHKGRLIEETNASDLASRRRRWLVVDARDHRHARSALEGAGYAPEPDDEGRLTITDERAVEEPDSIASLLAGAGVPPTHLSIEQEDLEAHFLRLTGSDA
jgi:ABC-2 type transport system ATP-binding protein